MYCRYGELESNSRGDFMKCPKDCECINESTPKASSSEVEESGVAYMMVGLFICAMLYVIFLLVDAITAFNSMMG